MDNHSYNPFETINARLSSIEAILHDLKSQPVAEITPPRNLFYQEAYDKIVSPYMSESKFRKSLMRVEGEAYQGPPYSKFGPRRILFNVDALQEWLLSQIKSSESVDVRFIKKGKRNPSLVSVKASKY